MYQNNELFKNKYRIDSVRLKGWDYSWPGYYFITICAKDRICYFGDVINCKAHLNRIGYVAKRFFKVIPKYYKHIKIDSFIVMPNHIHAILKIKKQVPGNCADGFLDDINNRVETHNCASLQRDNNCCQNIQMRNCPAVQYENKFGPQSKNISAAVRAFKSSVKKYGNSNNIEFGWQSRFYDHIIRNEESLNNIRQYIIENPKKWWRDRNNPEGLNM
ncbi:MAG: transposase [Patescibacteria group bacterium]|jgi:REP element-mobilizing transposase RayT